MKPVHLLPLLGLLSVACDQTAVKKEAYDRGYAEGLEAGKVESAKVTAAKATPQRWGAALDRPGTAAPGSQPHATGPASRMPGTALDQKPVKH